jgi:TolB protein
MDLDAQWSPDGGTLAFSRAASESTDPDDFSTCLVRRDGSDVRCLGAGSGARWSPDGRRLLITAPSAQSPGDLYVMGADGSNRRRLLATRPTEQPEDWSPDGKRILFTRYHDASGRDADVYVMRADGTRLRKLAHGRSAVWSPDGRRILYIRNYSELYVMNADGSRKRSIGRIVSAFEPDWR